MDLLTLLDVIGVTIAQSERPFVITVFHQAPCRHHLSKPGCNGETKTLLLTWLFSHFFSPCIVHFNTICHMLPTTDDERLDKTLGRECTWVGVGVISLKKASELSAFCQVAEGGEGESGAHELIDVFDFVWR